MTEIKICIIALFIMQIIISFVVLVLHKEMREDAKLSNKCLWGAIKQMCEEIKRIRNECDNLKVRIWNLEQK